MFSAIISAYRFLYLSLASFIGIGWAIVALSFITSALMAPLMRAVAGIVRREKEYEDVIQPQIDAINRAYASDRERNLHIQRLYARYVYSPLCAVKKVAPLFVQIPFLLLTYYMLKGTAEINGVSFLFLRDLGTPDALLTPSLNLLPLAMTLINILTVFATPGFTRRDWTQAIGISLLFLVLLYTAPSALLLYWTLNNAITFVRTLVAKNFAGARLLCSRIAAIPECIARTFRKFLALFDSPRFLSHATLVFSLLACYMYLVTQSLAGGWRNWYYSYYLMNLFLSLAIFCTQRLFRTQRLGSVLPTLALALAILVSVLNIAIDVSIPFTGAGLKFATQTVPFTTVFICLLAVWSLPFLLLVRPRPLGSAIREGFKSNWYFLLLPIALGIHYSFSSANFKLPAQSVVLLSLYLLLPCVLAPMAALVLFYRVLPPARVFRIVLGVVIAMWLLPMVSVENGKLLGYGFNMPIRILMLTVVPLLLLRFKNRITGVVFVSLFSLVLVVTAFTHRTAEDETARTPSNRSKDNAIATATCTHSNNVYILVFDSYPHQTILDALGIDDHGTARFLAEHGFTSYCAYSEGNDTLGSMSAMFEIGGAYASGRARLAGNNHFSEFLKRAGYRTNYVLCGYTMPDHGEPLPGDFYFPSPAEVTRPEWVFLPWIVRGCLTQLPNTFNTFTQDEWLAVKRGRMKAMGSNKSFLYAHCAYPGHAIVSIANRKSDAEEIAAFSGRLAVADAQIRDDVQLITEHDPNAIVIVASDHGGILVPPSVPGHYDARHILDRCGIMLAIRWPKDYRPTLQLNCLQNVLLEVMIYMSGDPSLVRYEREGVTQPITHPVKAPAGVLKRGIIQSGAGAGQSIFSAASEKFHQDP